MLSDLKNKIENINKIKKLWCFTLNIKESYLNIIY